MSKIGLKREITDKFYTKTNIARDCFTQFINHVSPKKTDYLIEPSAGNGSFSNLFKEFNFTKTYQYDILPEHEGITKMDFLELDVTKFKECKRQVHVIGNPPFGRQSSIAKQFIKKCGEFAHSISFILPKSFKKESMNKVFPLNFHLVFEEDIPNDSFTIDEDSYHVECVFQVWIRKETEREVKKAVTPILYTYVKKTESPSLSIRRVGVNAGKLSEEIQDKSIQSHYFIKLKEGVSKDLFLEEYNKNVKFEFNNSVGPKSISKSEFDKEIIESVQNLQI